MEENMRNDENVKNERNNDSNDYYTKAEVNARLLLKADASALEQEVYVIHPDQSGHPDWKVTFQKLSIGVVTITVHMSNFPASGSGTYVDIITNVPSRFRPSMTLYYLCADLNNNERCVGVLGAGIIRVFNSQSAGCFGSLTYLV